MAWSQQDFHDKYSSTVNDLYGKVGTFDEIKLWWAIATRAFEKLTQSREWLYLAMGWRYAKTPANQ